MEGKIHFDILWSAVMHSPIHGAEPCDFLSVSLHMLLFTFSFDSFQSPPPALFSYQFCVFVLDLS